MDTVLTFINTHLQFFLALAVVLMGLADRLRGDTRHISDFLASPWDQKLGRSLDKIFYGWLAAFILGFPFSVETLYIIAGMFVGMTHGWGEPLGAALVGRPMDQNKLEWWQVGVLKKNTWLAVTARGVMWDVALIVGVSFAIGSLWLFPVYTIAFPAAILITNVMQRPEIGNWEHQEYIRGWLAGLLLVTSLFI